MISSSQHPRTPPALPGRVRTTTQRPRTAGPTPSNRTERWVREMIASRGGFDASGITVQVRRGKATLAGAVASEQDAVEAVRLAAAVRGVRVVENRLQVEGATDPA